jgi:predicted Zn-dependent protease with MMP-like domain
VVTDFEATVRRALDDLPPEIAAKLENVAITVEDERPGEPHVLGLFQSAPLLPRKITIYRLPLERGYGHDQAELERQIRITVLHEIAHYFGFGEDKLRSLGY